MHQGKLCIAFLLEFMDKASFIAYLYSNNNIFDIDYSPRCYHNATAMITQAISMF